MHKKLCTILIRESKHVALGEMFIACTYGYTIICTNDILWELKRCPSCLIISPTAAATGTIFSH